MGSAWSFLFGGDDDDDDDQNLFALLDAFVDNGGDGGAGGGAAGGGDLWDAVRDRLTSHPEEAAAYCHFVDPSPLSRCLKLGPPLSVVRAFVEAYPDAVFHHDAKDEMTPLLVALRQQQRQQQGVDDDDDDDDDEEEEEEEDQQQQEEGQQQRDEQQRQQQEDEGQQQQQDEGQQQEEEGQRQEQREQDEQHAIVKLLYEANPRAARQVDRRGRLALHYARCNADTARLLLEAHPAAVGHKDSKGRLPLHYCTRQQLDDEENDEDDEDRADDGDGVPQRPALCLPDPGVVRLLMEHATTTTTSAKLLHVPRNDTGVLCKGRLPHAGVLVKDKDGSTPLDQIFGYVKSLVDDAAAATVAKAAASAQPSSASAAAGGAANETRNNNSNDESNNDKQQGKQKDGLDSLWEVLTMFVAAVKPGEPLVHALAALGQYCPPAVFCEALRRFPHQAVQRDARGRTPLLVAVCHMDHNNSNNNDGGSSGSGSSSSSSTTDTGAAASAATRTPTTAPDGEASATISTNNGGSAETTSTTNNYEGIICALIRCNSAAARMTDREGRLPIDYAAERGVYSERVFEAMVMAEPRALDTRDLKYKQHPFLTAALAGEKANVATVYHLLRAKPHVIAYYNTS